MYRLSIRSLRALDGVHPDLVDVVKKAIEITEQDFTAIEGLRAIETQELYMAKGVSKTMKSKHLPQGDGYGHAVDLYPYYDGQVQVSAPKERYEAISVAMKQAAEDKGVKITWGGDWKSFYDGPHYQIEV